MYVCNYEILYSDIYVYYADLLCNVFTEFLKLLHYFIVIYVIGISFSLIGVYVIMRVRTSWMNIRGNIKAYKSYQQIYQALNHQYPDATKEELMIKKKKKKKKPSIIEDTNNEDSGDQKEEDENETNVNANSSSLLLDSDKKEEIPSTPTNLDTQETQQETNKEEPIETIQNESQKENVNNENTEEEDDVDEEEEEETKEICNDNVEYELCGICRDSMTEAKKLPCSHKFHLRCLMGWMRYKHTCPICRRSLNQSSNSNNNANNNNGANNNANNVNGANNNGNNGDLPWWLRLFSNFIQIHNVDIIDARNLNVARRNRGGRGGLNNNNRLNMAAQHRAPPNQSTEQQIARISEILGGRVSDQDIRVRLLRTHSMERTIEYFLNRQ